MNIKLSKQQQQMVFLAVMAIGGGGYAYWNYLMKPTLAEVAAHQKKLSDLRTQIASAEAQWRRIPELQAELERLRVDFVALEKQLPRERDVPSILRILTEHAEEYGVVFQSLRPAAGASEQYFSVLGYDLNVQCSMHNFARFMASLGQQERIFKFHNLRLAPSGTTPDGRPNLNITVSLRTYAYTG